MERKTNLATGEKSTGSPIDLHNETYENHLNVTPQHPEGWQTPEGHEFQRVKVDKNFYSNKLTKVNGVDAFSKASSLYKGTDVYKRQVLDSPKPQDYNKSGWDRGHLSAASNTSYPKTIQESFLMTNIAPQSAELNRGLWKTLEGYAKLRGHHQKAVSYTHLIFHF